MSRTLRVPMSRFSAQPNRRALLSAAAAGMLAGLLPGSLARAWPAAGETAADWMRLLGRSEAGGRAYAPRVEGRLPDGLRGTLYRNGPGLFDRGDYPIRHLLDGDGLVQRLAFTDAGVRYANRFVETAKFVAEREAGRRLHATWSTRQSANPLANLGGNVTESQAGVTVYPVHGRLLARDELGPSYEIDPETLETLGTHAVGEGVGDVGFKAHSKLDPRSGEWILAGTRYGPSMQVHAVIRGPDGALRRQFAFDSPRQVYIHDFFASENHLVFVLHPCTFSPVGFLAGLRSFTDSLEWRGGEGNIVAVVPRAGGAPRFFEAPAAYMWHALNAFEDGDVLIADFVGYDEPDHFIGEDALLQTLMRGRMGRAASPGQVRRYRIDLAAGRLAEEIVDAENHEYPALDGRRAMRRQRFGYFAHGGLGAFNTGLRRIDYESGRSDTFDFGEMVQVGEPVFAARPGGAPDEGWLIAQCLDGAAGTTFFALFDAAGIQDGPVARVRLTHPVPISFHGSWMA